MFKLVELVRQMMLAFPNLLPKLSIGQIVLDSADVPPQIILVFSDLLLQSMMRELVLEFVNLSH